MHLTGLQGEGDLKGIWWSNITYDWPLTDQRLKLLEIDLVHIQKNDSNKIKTRPCFVLFVCPVKLEIQRNITYIYAHSSVVTSISDVISHQLNQVFFQNDSSVVFASVAVAVLSWIMRMHGLDMYLDLDRNMTIMQSNTINYCDWTLLYKPKTNALLWCPTLLLLILCSLLANFIVS